MVAVAFSSSDRISASRVDAVRRKPLSRFSNSRTSSNLNLHRPPIILEWGQTVLRMGYAEQCRPTHLCLLPFAWVGQDDNNKQNPSVNKFNQKSLSQWYAILAPIVHQVYYDYLMETDPTSRRVVCCCAGLIREETWEQALMQIFWNLGVPAVAFVSGLQVVPLALGWKRGIVICFGRDESHCLAHIDGHALQDTYQAVPFGSSTFTSLPGSDQLPWWLDSSHPYSLTLALIKCFEACPKDALRDASSNLVFYGEGLVMLPDLARRVVVALNEALDGKIDSGKEDTEPVELEPLTLITTNTESIRPLANQIAINSIAPHRSDLISWTGTSVWATMQYRHGFDTNHPVRNHWILKPSA